MLGESNFVPRPELVSINASGDGSGEARSTRADVSSDGRFIVFSSSAMDLISGGTSSVQPQIYLRDMVLGTTTLVSTDVNGILGNRSSEGSSVSDDGRFITFSSLASNLVPNDTNDEQDIFVKDMQTGTITRISVDSNGVESNDRSSFPKISGDGMWVAYQSDASNLVANDTNNADDIFLFELATEITTRVSTDSSGNQSTGASLNPSLSDDGQFITFANNASDLVDDNDETNFDIFRKNRVTGAITRVSSDAAGNNNDGHSTGSTISGGGRFVAFSSAASTLVSGDNNGVNDIFVRDMDQDTIIKITSDLNGGDTDGLSISPSFSGNGRYVVFRSAANNMVANDTNGDLYDIFVFDLLTDEITRANITSSGNQIFNQSNYPTVSDDGLVVFQTVQRMEDLDNNFDDDIFAATLNLVPEILLNSGDSDSELLIANYNPLSTSQTLSVEDLDVDQIVTASVTSVEVSGDDNAIENEDFLAMLSIGSNPIIDDASTSGTIDWVFDSGDESFDHLLIGELLELDFTIEVIDSLGSTDTHNISVDIEGIYDFNRELTIVSTTADGALGNNDSFLASVSENGRYVAFDSSANNLVDDDNNPFSDIFVKDTWLGTITRASTTAAGVQATGSFADISANGRYVVFSSQTDYLVPDDTNDDVDIFVKDMFDGSVTRVSTDSAGVEANDDSNNPLISRNGRFVLFVSDATNLVPNDTNDQADLFVKDLLLGTTTRVNTNSAGQQSSGSIATTTQAMSDDGRYIAFSSSATDLIENDPDNGIADIFVKDLVTGVTTLPSNGSAAGDFTPSLSGNGRYLAFQRSSGSLVKDIFLTDLETGTTSLVSASLSGGLGNGESFRPSVSDDGRYVTFYSRASDLVAGDGNSRLDIFVRDMELGATTRISVDPTGGNSNGHSYFPSISRDGGFLVFESDASNAVAGDNNNDRDIFISKLSSNFAAGELNKGVAVHDSATGNGFLMYTVESGHTRFSQNALNLENSDHFVAVRFNQGSWQYNNNISWFDFAPRATDVLVAEVDFDADTVKGLGGTHSTFNGVQHGYSTGDLDFQANIWNGQANLGEFEVSGNYFTLSYSGRTTYAAGAAGNGIAVTDDATGNGYMMYSVESVHSRFQSNPPNANNSDHFIAVRFTGTSWQYNNNLAWVDFAVRTDDLLVAEVNFDSATVVEFKNIRSQINGVNAGFTGDLKFLPNSWNGAPNLGEFEFTGSTLAAGAYDIETHFAGRLGRGVAVSDNATGTGFMMHSSFDVHHRFADLGAPNPDNSDHFIAVRYAGGQWQYNNNVSWIAFQPNATDTLVASVNFGTDTIESLVGMDSMINGIRAGYTYGNLEFNANVWNGSANLGEFEVTGTMFKVATGGVASFAVGGLGSGIAASDNATGTGYMMYTEESVHTRFQDNPVHPANKDHFVAVRNNNGMWQYNNNSAWIAFEPTTNDVLVADINFSAGTISSLLGQRFSVGLIPAGYDSGDLSFVANVWNGQTNAGEFDVTGTSFQIGASGIRAAGELQNGVAVDDSATGTGYLMYSAANVFSRFASNPPNALNANHFIAVRYHNGLWQYNDNFTWVSFTPTSSDILVAEIDFDADTIVSLEGTSSTVDGIAAGYLSGDLEFMADVWGGNPNDGEFGITGTSFVV